MPTPKQSIFTSYLKLISLTDFYFSRGMILFFVLKVPLNTNRSTMDADSSVIVLTMRSAAMLSCKAGIHVDRWRYEIKSYRISSTETECNLPEEPLQIYERKLRETGAPGSNFYDQEPGGAKQVYRISVSNDGQNYGNSQDYVVYNRSCIDCNDTCELQVCLYTCTAV